MASDSRLARVGGYFQVAGDPPGNPWYTVSFPISSFIMWLTA
jgi:hypothetical protein